MRSLCHPHLCLSRTQVVRRLWCHPHLRFMPRWSWRGGELANKISSQCTVIIIAIVLAIVGGIIGCICCCTGRRSDAQYATATYAQVQQPVMAQQPMMVQQGVQQY